MSRISGSEKPWNQRYAEWEDVLRAWVAQGLEIGVEYHHTLDLVRKEILRQSVKRWRTAEALRVLQISKTWYCRARIKWGLR